MRIVKNTSRYSTADLKSIIVRVHAQMVKLEGRKTNNWGKLRIQIGGRSDGGVSGRAYYSGDGGWKGWDVYLSFGTKMTVHKVAWLAYHELMHSYGYRHAQYTNVKPEELARWFPEDRPVQTFAQKAKARDVKAERYARAVAHLKAWESRAQRADKLVKKWQAKVRYYEKASQSASKQGVAGVDHGA